MMGLTPELMWVSSSILRSIAHDLAHDHNHDNTPAIDMLQRHSDMLWKIGSILKNAQKITDKAVNNDYCL